MVCGPRDGVKQFVPKFLGTACRAVNTGAQPLVHGLDEIGLKSVVLHGRLMLRHSLSTSDAYILTASAPV